MYCRWQLFISNLNTFSRLSRTRLARVSPYSVRFLSTALTFIIDRKTNLLTRSFLHVLGDSDTGQAQQDILICGVCQKTFELGDINRFIQHKVHACCNKENYALEQNNVQESHDPDDNGCGGVPLAVVNTRRPSISAPIKKGVVNSNSTSRLMCSSPPLQLDEEARCSTPKPVRTPIGSGSPTPIKDEMDPDHHHHLHHHQHNENYIDDNELKSSKIKQELDSTNSSLDLLKKSKEVVDAESNTTHSGE